MAAHVPPISSATSLFQTPRVVGSALLLARVNWVFGATVFAGVSCCLYNLYKAYVSYYHPAYGFDDNWKAIKCLFLLMEADKRMGAGPAAAHLQLEECEALANSITEVQQKDGLLLNVVRKYAPSNPERACQIAERLSWRFKFMAAQSILEHASPSEIERLNSVLSPLFTQAFEARGPKEPYPPLEDFAKAFRAVGSYTKATGCIEEAIKSAEQLKNKPDVHVMTLCRIAQSYQEPGGVWQPENAINAAIAIIQNGGVSLQAHLHFAETLLSLKWTDAMKTQVDAILSILNKAPSAKEIQGIYLLAKLIEKIEKDVPGSFTLAGTIQPLIENVLNHLSTMPDTADRMAAYTSIVHIYGDQLLTDADKQKQAIRGAYDCITDLPTTTPQEIDTKITVLTQLIVASKNDPQAVQRLLTRLRLVAEVPSKNTRGSALDSWMVATCNEVGLLDLGERYFANYKMWYAEEPLLKRIITLTQCGIEEHLQPKQKKDLLEFAQSLLSELTDPAEHKSALAALVTAYLPVNETTGRALLADYESKEAFRQSQRLALAPTVALAGMAIMSYLNPKALPVTSLLAAAVTWLNSRTS